MQRSHSFWCLAVHLMKGRLVWLTGLEWKATYMVQNLGMTVLTSSGVSITSGSGRAASVVPSAVYGVNSPVLWY